MVNTFLLTHIYHYRLVKIQRKIFLASTALEYFVTNQWAFINDKFLGLETKLHPSDVEQFRFQKEVNPYDYFKNCILAGRKYLLKEDVSNLEQDKVKLYR